MIDGPASNRPEECDKDAAGSRSLRWVLSTLLMLATSQPLQAQDILHYLPEDALGFVLVRDLAGASEKCEHLIEMFDLPLPAPLTSISFVTDLSDGLDLDGDVLISLIPGERDSSAPEPLVLLPIADYKKFAASIHCDDSGEVCRATIVGEDVLVARHGPYAMIMNVENRETLEILADLEPEQVALLEPVAGWLRDNVVTIAVMPAGLERLLKLGQWLTEQRQATDDELFDLNVSATLVQMQQAITLYHTLHDMFGTKFELLAGGISIDEASNLRLGLRVLSEELLRASATTKTTATIPPAPLAGYPDQPFVFAGGGPLDGNWANLFVKTGVQMMRETPDAYGYEEFQDEQWQDLETSFMNFAEGMRFASVIMLPGEKGEPLVGNVFGTAQVKSAVQYLQTPKKSVEIVNRLTDESTSDLRWHYEVRDIKVGEAKACEVVADIAAAARDPNVPIFNWMLEAMFGKDGKMRTLIVAADKETLVYGMADEQRITQVIDEVKRSEMGLQNSASLQTTHKLLTPAAAWKFYVSPQGCVTWAKRVMDELFGQIQQQHTEIPEYDAGPPVGISLHIDEGQAELDVVWPVDGLRALADYVEKCRGL